MSRSEIKEEVKQRAFSYQSPGLNQYNYYFNTECLEEKRNEIILYALDNNNKLIKVKFKIINNIIFIFHFNIEKNDFSYSHFLFLNSTYLVIKGLIPLNNSIFYSLNLISTYGNYSFSIEIYSDTLKAMKQFKDIYNEENYTKDINNDYKLTNKEIGNGKYGICQLCSKKINNVKKFFCVKIINKLKKGIDEEEYKIMLWEKNIFLFLKKFPNQNIAKAYDYYENSEYIYLVSEYVNGYDLKVFYANHINDSNSIKSQILLSITHQIIKGINFLHSYGIIHRDIKHTNILINNNSQIKIIDFGLSIILGKKEFSKSPYGSLTFKAPEIIMEYNYNEKVDIWSYGVTLFYLIYGKTPFQDSNCKKIKERICKENIKIDIPFNYYGFELIINIINECLIKNCNSRPLSNEILNKFFKDWD